MYAFFVLLISTAQMKHESRELKFTALGDAIASKAAHRSAQEEICADKRRKTKRGPYLLTAARG
jgi:hypothetical protein